MPELVIVTATRLMRWPRMHCANCKRRRIVFSLLSTSDPEAFARVESPRLCAECAGIGR